MKKPGGWHAFYQKDYKKGGRFFEMTGPKKERHRCIPCFKGIHTANHNEMGCMQIMAPPPVDYVCECKKARA